jgi:hypothetical protein
MKKDLTTGAWQHDIGCPIKIVLFLISDEVLLFQLVQLVFCYNQNVHSLLRLLTCWGCVKKNKVG